MNECELDWLARQASRHKVIVEVGSWMGRSTHALAQATRGIVYAVDTWKGSAEHREMLEGKDPNWLFQEFMRYTYELPNIFPLRMTSRMAATWLKDHRITPDMVFIDADHEYDSVKEDILYWGDLLSPDGMLCGHDYGSWSGVTRAVDELVPESSLPIPKTGFYIWAFDRQGVLA